MYLSNCNSNLIKNTNFTDNIAKNNGGAIFLYFSSILMEEN